MSTILLIDGDEIYRHALQKALQRRGHQVQAVKSIREMTAVSQSRHQDAPDLVVLDWFLPDGVAAEAIRRLRRAGNTAPILVLVAAEAFDRILLQAEQGGATVVLNKSMAQQQLQRIISRLLRVSGAVTDTLHLGRNTVCRLEYPYPVATLPPAQAGLLRVLLDQPPGQFVSAVELASRLIVYTYRTDASRLVARRVSRLRRQLAPLGVLIESRRGQGYRLVLVPLPAPLDDE